MATEYGALTISVMAGLAAGLLALGVFRTNQSAPSVAVHRRVEQLRAADDADPLGQSFAQRVMQPLVAAIARVVTGILPTRILSSLAATLEAAGRPTTLNRFVARWVAAGVVTPLILMLMLVSVSGQLTALQVLPVLLWMGVALYLPWTSVRRKAQQRVRGISRDLPDAIDLIITNVEAGMGMQSALLVVSQKFGGPIGEDFGRAVREISLGADRTEALVSMAERSRAPEMRLFARAVAQAEQTGIPVARVLRNHSAEVREKRRQKAREQAAKIPVKITFPTVLIIFPTLFLLILGPVALNLMGEFGAP